PQDLRRRRRRRHGRARDRAGRVLHDARPVRLGKDDDAPHHRGLRAAGRRARPPRRQGRDGAAALHARREHRLPGLRAVSAHDGDRERRVRAAGQRGEAARSPQARRGGARAREARRLRRAEAGPALGRAAAASRARAGDRQPSARAAPRRAARRARPQAPAGDAGRAQADPGAGRDHVRLRHPRPGGGADDERPDRRVRPGPDRAGRVAHGGLRAAGERVRRGVRRRLERARAGRPPVHDPAGADPARRGRRARRRPERRLRGAGHPLPRRARARRPGDRRPTERRGARRDRAGPANRCLLAPRRHLCNPREEGGGMRRAKLRHLALALVAVALAAPAAGTTKATANEGSLSMIAWEGYLDAKWVKPFERQSGCKVKAKYAGSSDEMVTLMRSGGGGLYDMVSASGDASLRLIYGGDVQAVDVSKVPGWKQFFRGFQSPPNNTVKGKHYGISLQWGPNTLMFNTKKVAPAPRSWSALYDPKFKGKITVPNNPIQIADAALYLSKTRPSLGIKDPYELTKPQFDAAIALLKKQRPLVKKYWGLSSDEVSLFKNGDAVLGASWPYTTGQLQAAKVPVKEVIPREG